MLLACTQEPKVFETADHIHLRQIDAEDRIYKFGYIDKTGQVVIRDQFDGVREFSEGLAAVQKNGIWGYIDPRGTLVIPFWFLEAYPFHEGIARIKNEDKKFGFIDKTGSYVIPPIYNHAYDISDGLIRYRDHVGYNYINRMGDTLLHKSVHRAKDFEQSHAIISPQNKYGVIDSNSNYILEPLYDFIKIVSEHRFIVKRGQDYILVNNKGMKLSTSYQEISDFYEGKAVGYREDSYFLVDEDGNEAFRFDASYDVVEASNSNFFKVYNGQKCGLVDVHDNVVAPIQYDVIFNQADGRFVYQHHGKWGYLDDKGSPVILPQYDLAWDFKNGMARVISRGGIGFINKSGQMVIPPKFYEVKDFEEGLARVQIYN